MRIHLAPQGLESVLEEELGTRVRDRRGRLFVVEDEIDSHWAQNTWFDVCSTPISSISEAAGILRAVQRNWWLHSVAAHRRAELIREQLPPLKPKPLHFPSTPPTSPLGAWTLFDANTLVYASRCSSVFPDGEVVFHENKTGPPSRAYLKLWEFFTLAGAMPQPGQRVIDLGSSPGGWTWVLAQLGTHVISVDKAPLAEGLGASKHVEYRAESAFALEPAAVGPIDRLFSDVICYPERLLQLVKRWEGQVANLVCTVKFQGATDHSVVEKFLAIKGSRILHLFHNKHELTWCRLAQPSSRDQI